MSTALVTLLNAIVEGHVQKPAAALDGVSGGRGAVTAKEQASKLSLERASTNSKLVLPGIGDGVVAEDHGL